MSAITVVLQVAQRDALLELVTEQIGVISAVAPQVSADTECEHCRAMQRRLVARKIVDLGMIAQALRPKEGIPE